MGVTIALDRAGSAAESRRTAVLLAGWLLAIAGIVALRSLGNVPLWDTVWAEDATVFLQSALDRSAPAALVEPYAGYLHVPARLVAEVAVLFGPDRWALVVSGLSTLIALGGSAYVYVASASVMPTTWGRAAVASLPWLVMVGEEVPAAAANLHWYGLYVAFWALMSRPASGRGIAAAGIAVTLVALSDPLLALGLPLAVLQYRALPGPRLRRLGVIAPLLAALAVQAVATLSVSGPERFSAFRGPDAVGIYGQRVAGGALLGDEWFGRLWDAAGWLAIWGAIAVAAVGVAAAAAETRGTQRRAVLIAAAGSVVALVAPLAVRGTVELAPDAATLGGSRYMFVPALLLLVAIAVGLDARGGRRLRQGFTLLLVAVAISGIGSASERALGPSWTGQLAVARTACAQGAPRAAVTVSPSSLNHWQVTVPCTRLGAY